MRARLLARLALGQDLRPLEQGLRVSFSARSAALAG
jgi:hypothetical protein